MDFCDSADYPMVIKLSRGIQANNVQLVHSARQAHDLIRRHFGGGMVSKLPRSPVKKLLRHRWKGLRMFRGKPLPSEIEHNYFYAQEFLSGNDFDTRATRQTRNKG